MLRAEDVRRAQVVLSVANSRGHSAYRGLLACSTSYVRRWMTGSARPAQWLGGAAQGAHGDKAGGANLGMDPART